MTYGAYRPEMSATNARTLPATTRGAWGSITGIAYSPLGKPTKVSNGAGIDTYYTYDQNHFRLSDISFAGPGAPALSYSYQYDSVGNVRSIAENGTTTTFGYDPLDRLVTASGGFSAEYRYDPYGDLPAAQLHWLGDAPGVVTGHDNLQDTAFEPAANRVVDARDARAL